MAYGQTKVYQGVGTFFQITGKSVESHPWYILGYVVGKRYLGTILHASHSIFPERQKCCVDRLKPQDKAALRCTAALQGWMNACCADRLCEKSEILAISYRSLPAIAKLVAQLDQRAQNYADIQRFQVTQRVFTHPPDQAAVAVATAIGHLIVGI